MAQPKSITSSFQSTAYFVIETKNMDGWIFGSVQQETWTQQFFKKKFKFQNPLRQNYRHTRCLAEFLNLDHDLLHSILAVDQDVGLWSAHDRIRCPVLLLRGLHSEVLPTPIAQEMTQRGSRAELVEFPKIGHAPAPTANNSSRALRLKIDQLHAARRR